MKSSTSYNEARTKILI